MHVCSAAQLCPTLCNTKDSSPLGSSVRGIFQGRILEWLLFPTPGDLLDLQIEFASLASLALAAGFFSPPLCRLGLALNQNTNYYYVYCYLFFHPLVPEVLIVFIDT